MTSFLIARLSSHPKSLKAVEFMNKNRRWPMTSCSVRPMSSFNAGSPHDYYYLLGVKKDATQRQIKAAYYALSKKYHPDVAGSESSAATKFLQINEAYECLRDPNRRRAYDNQRYGGGGRYTGDSSDPFRAFYQQRQGGNPFYNKEFTQTEYERIWKEFDRLRNQRETYDQRMEYERQRLWLEFAKRRAERWQQFHQRYPNGPPGSIKWEWRWSSANGRQNYPQGWELIRRILVVYFACFFMITIVQIVFQQMGAVGGKQNNAQSNNKPKIERDQIEAMMTHGPPLPATTFVSTEMQRPAQQTVLHEQPRFSLGREISYSDGPGSKFSMYVPTDEKRTI